MVLVPFHPPTTHIPAIQDNKHLRKSHMWQCGHSCGLFSWEMPEPPQVVTCYKDCSTCSDPLTSNSPSCQPAHYIRGTVVISAPSKLGGNLLKHRSAISLIERLKNLLIKNHIAPRLTKEEGEGRRPSFRT